MKGVYHASASRVALDSLGDPSGQPACAPVGGRHECASGPGARHACAAFTAGVGKVRDQVGPMLGDMALQATSAQLVRDGTPLAGRGGAPQRGRLRSLRASDSRPPGDARGSISSAGRLRAPCARPYLARGDTGPTFQILCAVARDRHAARARTLATESAGVHFSRPGPPSLPPASSSRCAQARLSRRSATVENVRTGRTCTCRNSGHRKPAYGRGLQLPPGFRETNIIGESCPADLLDLAHS